MPYTLIKNSWQMVKSGDAPGLNLKYGENPLDAFGKIFYIILFKKSNSVKALFSEDIRIQARRLADMIDRLIVMLYGDPSELERELKNLAERHHGYGARPEHYPIVGTALVQALHNVLGDDFSDEVKEAWVDLYSHIESIMKPISVKMCYESSEPESADSTDSAKAGNTNTRTFSKQIGSALERHYEPVTDASSVSSEWPQARAHSSLKRRTKMSQNKKQELESYKEEKYSADMSEALKLWQDQASTDTQD